MNAPHHNRKRGGKSQRHQDLERLCGVMNGSVLDNRLVHFCWDASAGGACCEDDEDCLGKMVFACSCALFGEADPVPAESRWTHLLMNMRKTLLRRCVHGLGLDAFQFAQSGNATEPSCDIDDAAATEAYHELVNKSRLQKTQAYFANPRSMHELVVYCAILAAADENLLYPFMHDCLQDDTTGASKMEMLLHPMESKVGVCFRSLYDLLAMWTTGGARRRPWCLLDVVGAPMEDSEFLVWVRSQVLRLAAALFRRYECRLSGWPFKLFKLVCSAFSADEKQQVISDLIGARKEWLDTYSLGIRTKYPSAEALMSEACLATLANDFERHGHSIAQIERLNAELTRGHNPRAPARNFASTASSSVLRQACVVHRRRGGEDPLAPQHFTAQAKHERLVCNSCVLPLVAAAAPCDAPVLTSVAPPVAAIAGPLGGGAPSQALVAETSPGQLVELPGPHVAFGQTVVVQRNNPSKLFEAQEGPEQQPSSRRGLSPYMLEKNKHLSAAKQALGRPMTPAEQQEATAAFKALWAKMDQGVFRETYSHWRAAPSAREVAAEMRPYMPSWGGGCSATPLTKFELHKHIRERGWPSDQDLLNLGSELKVACDEGDDFSATAGYNLWGIGRLPRNVDRNMVDRVQFNLCEKGLFNVLETRIGKEVADSGRAMLMITGPSLAQPGRKERSMCLVSGTCYSPKVWDATCLQFESKDMATAPELQLPCWVRVGVRECLVSNRFMAIDMRTSDEFILDLTQRMLSMEVHLVNYTVAEREGTLLWSRVDSVEATARIPLACVVLARGATWTGTMIPPNTSSDTKPDCLGATDSQVSASERPKIGIRPPYQTMAQHASVLGHLIFAQGCLSPCRMPSKWCMSQVVPLHHIGTCKRRAGVGDFVGAGDASTLGLRWRRAQRSTQGSSTRPIVWDHALR